MYPLKNGIIQMQLNDKIDVFCKEFSNIPKKESVTLKCTSSGIVIEGLSIKFTSALLACKESVTYKVVPTGFKCYKDQKIHDVGFQLAKKFVVQYSTCVDDKGYNVLYVEHSIERDLSQKNERVAFEQLGYFKDVDMLKCYSYENLQAVYKFYGINIKELDLNGKYISKGE